MDRYFVHTGTWMGTYVCMYIRLVQGLPVLTNNCFVDICAASAIFANRVQTPNQVANIISANIQANLLLMDQLSMLHATMPMKMFIYLQQMGFVPATIGMGTYKGGLLSRMPKEP